MERVLIIEDELPMRTALEDVLAAEGYRVLTAADGEIGLQRAMQEKPDLILLDLMMPKLDGYSVCAELRRLSNPVPILMLTAKGQIEDRVKGLDVGADDYLVKPFSTEELLARVRAVLRRLQRAGEARATLALGGGEGPAPPRRGGGAVRFRPATSLAWQEAAAFDHERICRAATARRSGR